MHIRKEVQRPPRGWPTAGQTSSICALGLCRQHFQPWSHTFSASQADPRPNQGFRLLSCSQSKTQSPCAEEAMREGQRLEAPPRLLSHDHRRVLSLSFLISKMQVLSPPRETRWTWTSSSCTLLYLVLSRHLTLERGREHGTGSTPTPLPRPRNRTDFRQL